MGSCQWFSSLSVRQFSSNLIGASRITSPRIFPYNPGLYDVEPDDVSRNGHCYKARAWEHDHRSCLYARRISVDVLQIPYRKVTAC